jgi:hypothetical protein
MTRRQKKLENAAWLALDSFYAEVSHYMNSGDAMSDAVAGAVEEIYGESSEETFYARTDAVHERIGQLRPELELT